MRNPTWDLNEVRQHGLPGHVCRQERKAGEGVAWRNKQGKCTILWLIGCESRVGRREGPQMTPGFGMGYSGCLRCATCRTEVGTRQVGKEVKYTDPKLRREGNASVSCWSQGDRNVSRAANVEWRENWAEDRTLRNTKHRNQRWESVDLWSYKQEAYEWAGQSFYLKNRADNTGFGR